MDDDRNVDYFEEMDTEVGSSPRTHGEGEEEELTDDDDHDEPRDDGDGNHGGDRDHDCDYDTEPGGSKEEHCKSRWQAEKDQGQAQAALYER